MNVGAVIVGIEVTNHGAVRAKFSALRSKTKWL